jgi:hypothetical protein
MTLSSWNVADNNNHKLASKAKRTSFRNIHSVSCTAIGQEWQPGLRHTTQESFTITVVEELPPVVDDGEVAVPSTTDTGGQ